MKKFDNFSKCLKVLKKADFKQAFENEIYRIGVIGQFNLTFELSWKALQEVLRNHGVDGADVEAEELVSLIKERFISTFSDLEETLKAKIGSIDKEF